MSPEPKYKLYVNIKTPILYNNKLEDGLLTGPWSHANQNVCIFKCVYT